MKTLILYVWRINLTFYHIGFEDILRADYLVHVLVANEDLNKDIRVDK